MQLNKIVISIFLSVVLLSFTATDKRPIGVFKIIQLKYYVENNLAGEANMATSYIYEKNANPAIIPFKKINDGEVKLNSKKLIFDEASKDYLDTSKVIKLDNIVWSKTNGLNPSFIYTLTSGNPSFSAIERIPTTISKSNNLQINLANCDVVADKIEFTINDGVVRLIAPWYRKLSGNVNMILIPKNNFLTLTNTNEAYIIISFIKEETYIVNNEKFLFENRLQIKKKISITN